MRREFLGDALDHWKGAMLESLLRAKLITGLNVDPMISDPRWGPAEYALYVRLLKIDPTQVIRHRASLNDRERYFGEIPDRGDLFLDPDTGIRTSGNGAQYAYPKQINELCGPSNRLVIVYQHIRAQKVKDRVDNVIKALRDESGHLYWCSYESPTVAMLFLSRGRLRPREVQKYFSGLLGKFIKRRVRGNS